MEQSFLQIVDAIQNVGFPIVAFLILAYAYYQERKKNEATNEKVLEAFTETAVILSGFKAVVENLAELIKRQ